MTVPAGAKNMKINVQDVVKRGRRTRFVYRGRGNPGKVSFTKIQLCKVKSGPGYLADQATEAKTRARAESPVRLPKSATIIPIAKNDGFTRDQDIIIDAGKPNEESNRVAGFGSLYLEFPLLFDHEPGAVVSGLVDEDTLGPEEPELKPVEPVTPVATVAPVAPVVPVAPVADVNQAEAAIPWSAGLDSKGFFDVTSLCCPWKMEVFFGRVLDSMGLKVCSAPHVQGLMHWFTCVPNMDFQYMIDVINNGNPCKFWAPKEQECPVLSPECAGHWCR